MSDHAEAGKKVYMQYAGILGILAVLTVVMVFIGESGMSEAPKAVLLLLGSSIKASLIIFYFMHLKFERMGLIMIVMVGIFLTSVLMFVVPAYDGSYILQNSTFR